MKKSKYGLPYMGSKRKIAKNIVDKIFEIHPDVEIVYDLFGGGGAITFELAKHDILVVYNDIDTAIVNLLKKLFEIDLDDYGNLPKEFYRWIDRKEFKEMLNKTDWFSGLVHIVWSFGSNKTKGYLYAKNNEKNKLKYHNLCVKFDRNIQKERLKYNRLQHIERLKNLEDIIKYPYKNRIELKNKDFYSFLDEINNSDKNIVVYLDPPYQNTIKYKYTNNNLFNKINRFINNCNKPIFLSEYNNHYNMQLVWYKYTKSLFNTNDRTVVEKLFYKYNV